MVFVTISPKQAAQYAYMCVRLKRMVNKMYAARKALEAIANTSFDKSFARCMYMLTSESLQCENEIRAHIDSLNCERYETDITEKKEMLPSKKFNGIESICNYFEEVYLNSYKKLLNDKHFASSLKSLIQNHIRLFKQSLTQLRLFDAVKTGLN
ncbi:MAG TPA: hypothetical protein VFW07_00210 [Parafilimonas sp.]|nr:hypothetical protein [Parafilimonas sp.]